MSEPVSKPNNLTPTPRTDAAAFWARTVDQTDTAPPHEKVVAIEDTQELERELAAALKERDGWEETAARHLRNESFYRNLLGKCAAQLGEEVRRQDDGGMLTEGNFLALKVPEVLAERIAQLTKERDELQEKYNAAQDAAADLLKQRDESREALEGVRELLATEMRERDKVADALVHCGRVTAPEIKECWETLDLMRDEFQRILVLTEDAEIKGLCERAQKNIKQRVPLIEQRDKAEAERDQLKAQLAELQADKERLRKLAAELYTSSQVLITSDNNTEDDHYAYSHAASDVKEYLRAALDQARGKEQA